MRLNTMDYVWWAVWGLVIVYMTYLYISAMPKATRPKLPTVEVHHILLGFAGLTFIAAWFAFGFAIRQLAHQ
jgi:hypothetical protein